MNEPISLHKSGPEGDPLLPVDAEEAGSTPARTPGGWRCMPYILGNEAFGAVASNGLTANLTVYLVERYGMKQVEPAKFGVVWGGISNFTPLLGAFVADSYWGRFRTLGVGSVVSFLGMVCWTLASAVPQLHPPSCIEMVLQSGQCAGPTKFQLCFLYFSLVLLALGSGCARPCTLPFGMDQFDCDTEQGQRGTISVLNWYYATLTAAALISMTLFIYIQDSVSWSLGFGIPTILMLVAVIFFFIGSQLYVNVPPEGSAFSGIVRVYVASFKNRKLKLPSSDDEAEEGSSFYDPPISNSHTIKLPQSQQFRFLNKGALKCEDELSVDGYLVNTWRLCSIQQIEEVKCLMRIMPIWVSGVIFFVAITQQWSFVVLQSLKMDRHLGSSFQIPAGSVVGIGMVTLIVFIPIYDRIIVPALRSITKTEGGITVLQRQGVGIVLSTVSMFLAARVEKMRRDSALSHGGVSPLSVMWLIPQLVLMGIAQSFNGVGQIEFYYRQFPESMQTLAGSLFFLSEALANYMATLLMSIIQRSTGGDGRRNWLDNDINEGRLDYYFYVITAVGVMNLLYFLLCANSFHYKGMLNDQKSRRY